MKNFEGTFSQPEQPYEIHEDSTTSPEQHYDLTNTENLDLLSKEDLEARVVGIFAILSNIRNEIRSGMYSAEDAEKEIHMFEKQKKDIDEILMKKFGMKSPKAPGSIREVDITEDAESFEKAA